VVVVGGGVGGGVDIKYCVNTLDQFPRSEF
ncbi:MAG: hypothetical protein ACI8RD_006521, partial [Bacillariaceae sp.]